MSQIQHYSDAAQSLGHKACPCRDGLRIGFLLKKDSSFVNNGRYKLPEVFLS